MLYPFLMMDIPAGNALPDPYSGAASQPRYPWRGRITCDPAPDEPGNPEGSGALAAQVAAFVGAVGPADMSVAGSSVACAKPDEWSYRRLVMHCAALAQAAGGVEGFVVGSEMVGLTHLRGAAGYPMVDHLVAIAQDVKAMLPGAVATYAADWTEYGADVRNDGEIIDFPLDPLWASPAIGAIGIDFYPPLSDWRDSSDHADANVARGPADPAYLRQRLTAGVRPMTGTMPTRPTGPRRRACRLRTVPMASPGSTGRRISGAGGARPISAAQAGSRRARRPSCLAQSRSG